MASDKKNKTQNRSFTLIELIVAVSILSIGIVLIARSLLSASSALDTGQNRISAIRILESKMNELELKEIEEAGIAPQEERQQISVNLRPADFTSIVEPVDIEELKNGLNEVKLRVGWQESGKEKDALLFGYFKNKKE